MNDVFDSKLMVFDTNISSKSLKFKHKLRRVRETGPRTVYDKDKSNIYKVKSLLRGQHFCTENKAFQEGWPVVICQG